MAVRAFFCVVIGVCGCKLKGSLSSLKLLSCMFAIRKTAFVQGKSCPDTHKTKNYREHVAKRHKLLLEIRPALGYEVGIHNFKNYVLRGSDKYFERIRKGLQRIP